MWSIYDYFEGLTPATEAEEEKELLEIIANYGPWSEEVSVWADERDIYLEAEDMCSMPLTWFETWLEEHGIDF